MADLSALWTDMPECRVLCDISRAAVQSLEYHYVAAISYLTIIGVIAAAVLRKDYFNNKLFNKLKPYGIDREGAKDVWLFTIAIVAFNAILHAAQLTDATILTNPWIPRTSWPPGFLIVYAAGNAVLWLWLANRFRQDAAEFESFDKKKKLLIAYFKPVVVLWAIDDTLSKNWDFLGINGRLHDLLDYFQGRTGWVVPITLAVLTVIAVALIVLELRWEDKLHGWGWALLVFAVPRATRIVAAAAVLAISVGAAGYFFLGVGNRNTAEAGPTQIDLASHSHIR
jgi:hypothetical protein